MFTRTSSNISRPPFVVDRSMVVRDGGHQIDWDTLGPQFEEGAVAVTTAETVEPGETAVDVVALPVALKEGTLLDFGDSEGGVVTASAAIATATTVGVTALPRAMRSGEILDFGVHKEVQLTANAAKGATTITVEALDTALAGGETFTVPVVRMVLHVAADAAAGAVSITVDPADVPIESGVSAYVDALPRSTGRKIRAGTVMDELSSGQLVPSSLNTGGVTAKGILETDAEEDSRTDASTGYGLITSGSFYENLLPEASGSPAVINSTWKTELLARGGFWLFSQYSDDTAS